MDVWLDNAIHPAKHTLVDLGYVACKTARARADKLRKHVGGRNFMIVASRRLLVRLPANKTATILKKFPAIRTTAEQPGYCWCTHTWLDPESIDIKFAHE